LPLTMGCSLSNLSILASTVELLKLVRGSMVIGSNVRVAFNVFLFKRNWLILPTHLYRVFDSKLS
jgi:hypothetical protein